MSFLSTVAAGLTKAENFLINVFTKVSDVDKTLTSLAPATKAAMLATFYDVATTIATGAGAAEAAATGNMPLAITLSQQTLALVQGVVADAKTDGSVIVADLKALGIVKP